MVLDEFGQRAVVRGAEPGGEGNESRQYDDVFDPFASGHAQAADGRKAKFERQWQEPRHTFFGETIHNEVRDNTGQKGFPDEMDVYIWHNRLDDLQQQECQCRKNTHAQQGVAEKAVAAHQRAEHPAKVASHRQVAPQRRRGLVYVWRYTAQLVCQHGGKARGYGHLAGRHRQHPQRESGERSYVMCPCSHGDKCIGFRL